MPEKIKHQIYFRMSDFQEPLYVARDEAALVARAVELRCIHVQDTQQMLAKLSSARSSGDCLSCVDIPVPGTSQPGYPRLTAYRISNTPEREYTDAIESEWTFTRVDPKDFLSYNDI
jgi:hypothetical protein